MLSYTLLLIHPNTYFHTVKSTRSLDFSEPIEMREAFLFTR